MKRMHTQEIKLSALFGGNSPALGSLRLVSETIQNNRI
jgi:hypothetical protein